MRRGDAAPRAERDSVDGGERDTTRSMIAAVATQIGEQVPAATLRAARRQFERDYVALVLRRHQGRVGDAARTLGIQRTNLYRKARQLGISVAVTSRTER